MEEQEPMEQSSQDEVESEFPDHSMREEDVSDPEMKQIFASFREFDKPNDEEWDIIHERIEEYMQDENTYTGRTAYCLIEDYVEMIYEAQSSRAEEEFQGRIVANTIAGIIKSLHKYYIQLEMKYRVLRESYRQEVTNKIGREAATQTDIPFDGSLEREKRETILEEMEIRLRRLEEAREVIQENVERPTVPDSDGWNKVLGRKEQKKKRVSLPHPGEGSKKKQIADPKRTIEEETREVGVKKKGNRPLQVLKKKVKQGAGVLLEIQGSKSENYGRIVNECQRRIKLEELGIPPIGIRKARGGESLWRYEWIMTRRRKPDYWLKKSRR